MDGLPHRWGLRFFYETFVHKWSKLRAISRKFATQDTKVEAFPSSCSQAFLRAKLEKCRALLRPTQWILNAQLYLASSHWWILSSKREKISRFGIECVILQRNSIFRRDTWPTSPPPALPMAANYDLISVLRGFDKSAGTLRTCLDPPPMVSDNFFFQSLKDIFEALLKDFQSIATFRWKCSRSPNFAATGIARGGHVWPD